MASLRAYATNRAAVARQALRDDGTAAAATAPPPMPTADTRAADEGRPVYGHAVTAVVSGLMRERDQARTDARALAAALTTIAHSGRAARLSGALAEVVARALTYPNAAPVGPVLKVGDRVRFTALAAPCAVRHDGTPVVDELASDGLMCRVAWPDGGKWCAPVTWLELVGEEDDR